MTMKREVILHLLSSTLWVKLKKVRWFVVLMWICEHWTSTWPLPEAFIPLPLTITWGILIMAHSKSTVRMPNWRQTAIFLMKWTVNCQRVLSSWMLLWTWKTTVPSMSMYWPTWKVSASIIWLQPKVWHSRKLTHKPKKKCLPNSDYSNTLLKMQANSHLLPVMMLPVPW